MICSTSSNNLLSNSAETQAIKWSLHCLQHMALYTCSSGFERSSYLLLNDVEELLRICGRKSCRTSLEKYFPLFFSLYTTMCSIETPTIPTFGAVVHRIRSFDSKKMRKCVGLPQNSSSSEWKDYCLLQQARSQHMNWMHFWRHHGSVNFNKELEFIEV